VCRLLGYVADRPLSVVDALGEDGFDRFTALTAVHGDGWGMSWQADDETIQTVSVADSAAHDATYESLARTPLGRAGFVHLRWASEGLASTPENTHPFVARSEVVGDVAFGHNGHITPIAGLEDLLDDASRDALRGTTDSERYFRFVLQRIDETGDERAGLADAVRTLHERFPRASLNALFLTPTHLYAVHVNSQAATPLADLRDLFGSDDAMPHGHATAYFDMAYRASPTAVQVISSGLPDEGWIPLPPDRILAVDLGTRAIEVLDPAPRPSAR
jgi:predicted glutamine amidotransferase